MVPSEVTVQDELTEIAVILDRSGSMASIQDDMQGGLWTTILEQHRAPGTCRVSTYQFDDVWEAVFEGRPSGEIKPDDCKLVPRGGTALNDAVVKSLGAIEQRLTTAPEAERPDKVIVLMITDGAENSSRENTTEDARRAIARATDKFDWQFVYLAADADGFRDGQRLTAGRAKTKVGRFRKERAREAYSNASEAMLAYRRGDAEDVDPAGMDED